MSSQEGGKYPDHLPPCCRSPPDNPNGTDIYVSAIVDHLVSVDDAKYRFEVCIAFPDAKLMLDTRQWRSSAPRLPAGGFVCVFVMG